jgi:penicillin-binding protein 1C
LIRSRNVPAVAAAAKLGTPDLYDFLQLAGVSRLAGKSYYGLALVLGGGEVTPEELAGLYAALANGGVIQPVSYLLSASEQKPATPPRLLSEEASFITLDMLRHTPRPDTALPAHPPIAWKTGTSWGFRDAWTAGVFGRHVLVVWVGNFDGSSNPALVGVDAAAPLFLRMVDALRAERLDPGEVPATHRLPDLRQIEVCAVTGDLPIGEGELCPVRANTWFIAGKSPIRISRLHRAVWVDERTGEVVCGPQPHARRRIIEQWDSGMRRLFRQAGLPRATLPATSCATDEQDSAPTITSPLRGVTHTLRGSRPEPLVLRAEAAAGARTIYWFADDALIGRAAPGEGITWLPSLATSGRHYMLRAVDDQGRAQSREVTVEIMP